MTIGNNTANFNSCASWDGFTGHITTVGTNGGPSTYGTFDQSGQLAEWNDLDGTASATKCIRNGYWGLDDAIYFSSVQRSVTNPAYTKLWHGLRIASSYSILNPNSYSNFVTVGDINNAASATGYGSVSYEYVIGKYMITYAEYNEFLNAVAATDTHALFYIDDIGRAGGNYTGGIVRSGISGNYSYVVKSNYNNKPYEFFDWFVAARYVNWLHNGKPSGSQNSSTTENGAYTLNGAVSGNAVAKNAGAKYHIPTENEWYKAAYYKGGGTNEGYWAYATQSNDPPTCVSANSVGDGPENCTVTNLQACTTNDFLFGIKLGRLTWTPINTSICSLYTGYAVEVFYTLGETSGSWQGWNWVSSLSTSSISVNVFSHTGQQRYRIRAQNTSSSPTLYTSWIESNDITYADGVFCSDLDPSPTPTITPTPTPTPTPAQSIVGCDHKILKLYIPNSIISPGGTRASSIQLRIGGGTCCSRSNIVDIPIPPVPPPPPPPQPEVCLAAGTDLYGYTAIISYDPVNCDAGHACNAAIFDFYINDILIGQANLNNQNDGGYREGVFTINDHIISNELTELKLVCALSRCHNGVGRVVLKDPSNNIVLAVCMPNDIVVAGSFICPCPKVLGSTHNLAENALNTHIQVDSGSRLIISATGTIDIGWPDHAGAYGPDGIPGIGNDPVSGFPYVSLLGRIGESGTVFLVGSSYDSVVNESGELYLFFYDTQPGDNSGFFNACVTQPTTISFTKNNAETNGCNGNQSGSQFQFPFCLNDCITTDPLGSDITKDGFIFSVSPIVYNPQGNTTYEWLGVSYSNSCSTLSSPMMLSSPCWTRSIPSSIDTLDQDSIRFVNSCNGYYKLWCRVTNNGVVADSDVYFFEHNPIV
jgi:hypothetical protein